MFRIERVDDRIWLTENPGGSPVGMNFTPGQATLVSGKLAEAAKADPDEGYCVEIEV